MASSLTIYQFGGLPDHQAVNGLNFTLYTLARYQAKAGHKVTVFLHKEATSATKAWAATHGFELLQLGQLKKRLARDTARDQRAPIAHFHSAYRPDQIRPFRLLRRAGATLVVTPNGALIPMAIRRSRRSWLKKSLYITVFERRRLAAAHALVGTTPGECRSLLSYVGNGHILEEIPNPSPRLASVPGVVRFENRIVYLGRYDVQHKGLERLAALATQCPEIDFQMYGAAAESTRKEFEAFRARLPANIHVNGPVFGKDKELALSRAKLIIMPSAWEGFGIVLVEGMMCGAPCVTGPGAFLAEVVHKHDLGYVLPADPRGDADFIRRALGNTAELEDRARRARAFAEVRFDPARVSEDYVSLYERASHVR